jgi:hypothetical protein
MFQHIASRLIQIPTGAPKNAHATHAAAIAYFFWISTSSIAAWRRAALAIT